MIKRVNLPRAVANHLIGEHHSLGHRMVVGVVIMVVGVGTAKAATIVPALHAVHFGLDLVGYLVHGLGAVPFIEYLIHIDEAEQHKSDDKGGGE